MTVVDRDHRMRSAVAAVEEGNTLVGLIHFQHAFTQTKDPTVLSCLGYCLANEQRQIRQALSLCQAAIAQDPFNPLHYLNLGRTYLLAEERLKAIRTFRKGLKQGRSPRILEEIRRMGMRRSPVLSSLSRTHPLNKYLGIFLRKFGMR